MKAIFVCNGLKDCTYFYFATQFYLLFISVSSLYIYIYKLKIETMALQFFPFPIFLQCF